MCTYCCKVVLSYAQNPDAAGDLRELSEDLNLHISTVDENSGSPAYAEIWTQSLRRKSSRVSNIFEDDRIRSVLNMSLKIVYFSGLGSNTFYQIQIQCTNTNTKIWIFQIQIQIQIFCSTLIQIEIQIQIHRFKYKYKYKYVQPNISAETVRIQNRAILKYMLMVCVS